MNARYVGFTPYADWYSFFSAARAATIRDMSTSIALVTCAAVSSERRMCSAMPRRIAETGSTARRPAGERPGGGGRGRRRRGGARRGAAAGAAAPPARPAGLDEGEDVLLRHAAAAAGAGDLARVDAVLGGDARDDRRDERLPFPDGSRTGVRAAACRSRSCRRPARAGRLRGDRLGRRLGAASGSGAAPARVAARRRRRSGRASCRRRRSRPPGRGSASRVPDAGLGTSVSILSVEISSSGSSASIVLALLLQPLRDRPLGDGHAHLRHDDVDCGLRGHRFS